MPVGKVLGSEGMRAAPRIEVPEGDREKLERWSSSRSVPVRLRERSLIVLKEASEGMTNKEIAAELGAEANKVGRWRRRYADEGLSGIEKERARGGNQGGRSGRGAGGAAQPDRGGDDDAAAEGRDAVVVPVDGAGGRGRRGDFVSRTWRAHGLRPHLSRTFKLSSDPRFEEKLRDVVGLYLDPPENAAVFSFDEKSSIQALDRTQPGTADEEGALRNRDARLQAARRDVAVRGAEPGVGRGGRPVLPPPPPPGGAALPARGGEDGAAGAGTSTSSSTTTPPTSTRR